MDVFNLSVNDTRANKVAFMELLKGEGRNNPNIAKTDLRIDVPLANSNGSYEFQINETNGADKPYEHKLGKDHLFMCTHIALYITKRVAGKETNGQLSSFPDANIFDTVDEALCLESIYQGKMSIQSESQLRNRPFLTHQFRYAPAQGFQKAAATSQGIEVAQFGPTIGEKGYYELGANLLFDGNTTNKVLLQLGSGLWTVLNGATGTNNLVLMLHGFYYFGELPSGQQGVACGL